MLARTSDFWLDDCWIADSTPVPCGMSRPTVKRSELAGYGYCASHSRFYWGLKLYLVCTPAGMPILWALADPKIGEREVLSAMLEVNPTLAAEHEGRKVVELERLRKGVFTPSSKGMLAALTRVRGHYSFHLPDLDSGHRPLRDPDAPEDD